MQPGDLLVEVLGQHVDADGYSSGLVNSSIWASTWLVNEFDITNYGWPVALPRFISRPSDSTMIVWPSGKVHTSTCGLTFLRTTPGVRLEAGHVDLVVEVADVAEDRLVLHRGHLLDGDDVLVAGRGDDDVGACRARRRGWSTW